MPTLWAPTQALIHSEETTAWRNRYIVPVKRVLAAAAAGILVASGAFLVADTGRYVNAAPPPSATALEAPLTPVSVNPDWILSGEPTFAQVEISRSPDGRISHGLWSCTGPTSFEWQFLLDETVYVLDGDVDIDYQGNKFTLHPGDSATFHSGTSAVWTVKRYLKKSYTLSNPGPLGRWWRSAFPS